MEMIADPIAYPYTSGSNSRAHQLVGWLQAATLTLAGLGRDGSVVQIEQTEKIGQAKERMGLLRSGAPLKSVFFQPDAWMLTPSQLFKEEEATTWLCQLFPCLPVEVKSVYLNRAGLHLTYSEPAALHDEVSPLQQDLVFRPLPGCLLTEPAEGFSFCLMDGSALGFLYYGGQLKWYQQFDCTAPEDLLWQALQAAKSAGLRSGETNLQLLSTMPEAYQWLALLGNYFIIPSGADADWQPVRALFQTLGACAS